MSTPLDAIHDIVEYAASATKEGKVTIAEVFAAFQRYEKLLGIACPSCGHAGLDAGLWDDGGIPQAMCQDVFHQINKGGQDVNES